MHRIVNPTPFPAALDIFPDRRGVDTLHVTLKATLRTGAALQFQCEQEQVSPTPTSACGRMKRRGPQTCSAADLSRQTTARGTGKRAAEATRSVILPW